MNWYKISKKVREQLSPEEREEVNNRFDNVSCSFAKDDDGYFCYTHRARSKSYKSISQIPKSKVDFIGSTSNSKNDVKTAQLQDIENVMYSVSDAHFDILNEYYKKGRKKGSMMSWSVIPFARLKKIWEDYVNTGVVRDEKGIDDIANQMFHILARIQAATDLSGHSNLSSEEITEKYGFKPIDPHNIDFYFNFLETKYGTPISDCGLGKLWSLAEKLSLSTDSVQKLLIIDQMLNVVHQRGDLAALFIEGGSNSLNQLSANPDENKEIEEVKAVSKVNWYKTAVADGEFRDLKDKVNNLKDDIRNLKSEDKDFDSRIKKIEKTIDSLNIGTRRFTEIHSVFTSLQRKLEQMEAVVQEWKNYKKDMDDNVKKQVEKHTKARIKDVSPQAY